MVVIDPVTLLLFLDDVVNNFLYKPANDGLALFIRKNIYIQHTLRRRFWWYESLLFLEDLQQAFSHASNKYVVILSAEDDVAPALRVRSYLHSKCSNGMQSDVAGGNKLEGTAGRVQLTVHWRTGIGHGGALTSMDTLRLLRAEL